MYLKIATIPLLLVSCMPSCASKIGAYEWKSNKPAGILVHSSVAVVVAKRLKYAPEEGASADECTLRKDEVAFLPIGDKYAINVEPSLFSKSEFAVTLNDNGTLKTLTSNSTPMLPELMKETAGLIKELKTPGKAQGFVSKCTDKVVSEEILGYRILKELADASDTPQENTQPGQQETKQKGVKKK